MNNGSASSNKMQDILDESLRDIAPEQFSSDCNAITQYQQQLGKSYLLATSHHLSVVTSKDQCTVTSRLTYTYKTLPIFSGHPVTSPVDSTGVEGWS